MAQERRRVDADIRHRIIEATLQSIADVGLHKTTHRLIAHRAELSPGSVTYHFSDLTEVFEQAFSHLVEQMSAEYRSRLERAGSREQACAAIVDMICGIGYLDARRMTLMLEMYSFGNFNEAVRRLRSAWLQASHQSLALHFEPATGRALDALIEGWPMHAYFEGSRLEQDEVQAAVNAIVEALEPPETAARE